MSEISCYLLVLGGLVLSLYQGWRGFMFQWLLPAPAFKDWSKFKKVFLLAFADGLTYFVTCASGFASLVLCGKLARRLWTQTEIEVGTAALLGFLAVFGILGVTGKMPYVIDKGKPPLSLGGGS